MRRVVITGRGAITPFGEKVALLFAALKAKKSGVISKSEWLDIEGLQVALGAPVPSLDEKRIPRSMRRSMCRASMLGSLACECAVKDAKIPMEELGSERLGLYLGSTVTSPYTLETFFARYNQQGMEQAQGTEIIKIMTHTVAVNSALYLGVQGRVESISAACATATQAIGTGFEAIKYGILDRVIAGGAEELHPITAGTFDILAAASRSIDPNDAPRPFDQDRNGLVLGEGAGVVVLEDRDRALQRKAPIYAEVVGFASICSAKHMTAPSVEAMVRCMQLAIQSAGLQPQDIQAVNAHGTGTLLGDAAEAQAIKATFSKQPPVTAFKGNTSHTLAASGGIETIGVSGMMQAHELWPVCHLENILPEGEALDFVKDLRKWSPGYVLKNSFAFGGINVSLVLAPPEQ